METKEQKCCNVEKLFDFALDKLPQKEADKVREHIEHCSFCREEVAKFRAFNAGLTALQQSTELTEASSEKIWSNLQNEVAKSVRSMEVKNAWQTLFYSKAIYFALASAAVVALVIGAGLLALKNTAFSPIEEALQGKQMNAGVSEIKKVEFELGATVTLQPESRATVDVSDADQGVIYLTEGSLKAHVNKLLKTQRFEVKTDDAVISVKGTAFEVEKKAPNKTRVTVIEGTVWVTPEGEGRKVIELSAGQSETVLGKAAYLAELYNSGNKALSTGDYKEAVALYESYLITSGNADNSEVEYFLAEALEQTENTESAIKLYEKLSRSAGGLRAENAFASLSALQKRLGRNSASLETWKNYLEAYPQGTYAQDALYALAVNECSIKPGLFYRAYTTRYAGTGNALKLRSICEKHPE